MESEQIITCEVEGTQRLADKLTNGLVTERPGAMTLKESLKVTTML